MSEKMFEGEITCAKPEHREWTRDDVFKFHKECMEKMKDE